MSKTADVIKKEYAKYLKADDHIAWLKKISDADERILRIPQEFYRNVLQSGRFKGSRLLDLGCGPVVHNTAIASAFFYSILMSDYVEDNCKELKRWLQGKPTLTQFLHIPAELEGYGSDLQTGYQVLENRVRKNVKQVARCDVLDDNIFLEEIKPEVSPPYDLVIANFCIETASPTFEDYVLALKRINRLLKYGGGLLMAGCFHRKRWRVTSVDFQYLSVSEADVRKALKESGFGNVDMETYGKFNYDQDHGGIYVLAAERI